jgi:hypothetical protein
MASKLFATKPLSLLLAEEQGENRLRRILGPTQLTALGVGAIIGTGIFILTGVAAHDRTGPALMLSFVLAVWRASLQHSVTQNSHPWSQLRAPLTPTPTRRSVNSSPGSSAGT